MQVDSNVQDDDFGSPMETAPLLDRKKDTATVEPHSADSVEPAEDLESGFEDDQDAIPEISDCASCCHMFFVSLRTIGCVSLICLATSQVLLIMGRSDFLKNILRIDIIVFSLIFILVEIDGPAWLMKRITGVKHFVMRGYLYTYFGLVGMEESATAIENETYYQLHEQLTGTVASMFIQISSWALIVLGALYILLGLCCMEGVSKRLREKYKEKRKRWNGRGRREQ